ncbi:DUF4396 domain-containing protein [Streptomyces sp. NPDC015220]|uniref:DUF4396 domain-containing protein n=1 Tax=Streptomyces sp. NPDC015220 TaxID=3364947 RepID=UPI0036FDDFC2
MPPPWLTALAWAALAVAFVSAGWILFDIYGRGYRQHMGVMEAVWPVTALYFGPAAVAAYRAWGRPRSHRRQREHGEPPGKPGYATTAVGVSHCGAGCTLGDIIAEFAVFGLGITIGGLALPAEYIGDYVLALALGIGFQYFAIAPMRGLGPRKGLIAAAKADVLSLTAFEVGLFGWMALMFFVFFPAPHHLRPDDPVYWFLMQIGMIAGFFTAWPVNTWLIRSGIKEAM